MPADKEAALQELRVGLEALKEAMERIMSSSTADFAKWVTFKSVARQHMEIAKKYSALTGKPASYYDASKMKDSGDTIWPQMKQVFEAVYIEVSALLPRIKPTLVRGAPTGFDDLLHARIKTASSNHYQSGDYRSASLDAVTALFDMVRERTGLDQDGEVLCNNTFSPSSPILILSDLETDSGRNDQRGFLDIFKGFYRGVRNPKAHTLNHDLDAVKTAQHMVLASMLARRVDEAKKLT